MHFVFTSIWGRHCSFFFSKFITKLELFFLPLWTVSFYGLVKIIFWSIVSGENIKIVEEALTILLLLLITITMSMSSILARYCYAKLRVFANPLNTHPVFLRSRAWGQLRVEVMLSVNHRIFRCRSGESAGCEDTRGWLVNVRVGWGWVWLGVAIVGAWNCHE